jgi:hypothetical protein
MFIQIAEHTYSFFYCYFGILTSKNKIWVDELECSKLVSKSYQREQLHRYWCSGQRLRTLIL